MKRQWRKESEWTIQGGNNPPCWAVRYYGSPGQSLQVSQYRGPDDFDKHMKHTYKWFNKWYVQIWPPDKEWLFDTKPEAIAFAKQYMQNN